MDVTASSSIAMATRPAPDDLIFKTALPDYLVKHYLDVMRCMPIAMVIKRACDLQHARKLHATRAHEFDVCLRRFMPILEGSLLLRLAPEHFIVAIRVEWRIDVDQIDALSRKFAELVEAVSAINDPSID